MKKSSHFSSIFFPTVFILLIPAVLSAQLPDDTCGTGYLNSLKLHDQHKRLHVFRDWLLEINKPCNSIVGNLEQRVQTFSDTVSYSIDTSDLSFSGKPSSPVQIIMYVSMSCPLCKSSFCELYNSVTSGRISKKAKLAVKPCGTSVLDRALVAASFFGKQAALIQAVAPIKNRLTIDMIFHAADSLKIPLQQFKKKIDSPEIEQYVQDSRKEALENGVKVTPTFFINSHRYRSYKDTRWVEDAVEFMFEP